MSDDARIEQLLDELADSHARPEEVCANCPELLPEVRGRWLQMRRLGADLDALFPPLEVPRTKVDDFVPPTSAYTPPGGQPCRRSRATRSRRCSAAAAWASFFAPATCASTGWWR